jgi:hypothetical protein
MRRWRENPVLFVREVLGAEPDAWQADVLQAFPKHQRLAMKACKGPGKTTVLAWLMWNFFATRPFPKILATSVTGDNLGDNLWPELAKWRDRSDLLRTTSTWMKTRIIANDHPEQWFMSARTWPKGGDSTDQAHTLAGTHADYMLFVLDESGGIPDAVSATAEAGLSTGIDLKIVQAGNPTHLEGPLYRACTSQRHLWHVVDITGDPDDPKRSPRISTQWAREQIEMYGKENPWVQVNVFGNFPPSSLNTLLGPEEVRSSIERNVLLEAYEFSQKRIGVDVARFGSDSTIIFPRQGLKAMNPVVMRNARCDEISARVMLGVNKWQCDAEFVDDTGGFGAGVIDFMLQSGSNPYAINFSSKATDSRYFNRRSEMWFEMAEWVKRGGQLPNIPELMGDLTTPQYTFQNGKFRLEEKEQIRKRLGRSPDYGDALALTFALPDMPRLEHSSIPGKYVNYVSDYNPFADDRM